MSKVHKWVAKNKTLAMILFLCVGILAYTWILYDWNVPLWLIFITDLLIALIVYVYVKASHNYLLKRPLEEWTQLGDPTSLYNTTQELLTYKLSDADRQLLLIDHCTALREMGQLKKAYDILSAINIDKYPGTLPYAKAVYYNNLSDLCDLLGDEAQAEIWYNKLIKIYNDMPDDKFRRLLTDSVNIAAADQYIKKGYAQQAVTLLRQIQTESLPMKLSMHLLYAKVSIEMKDFEAASKHLNYVIENGNKLYAVTVARKLLKDISEQNAQG